MKLSTIAFATLIAGGIAWNAHAGPTLADINKAAIGTEAKANTIKLQTLLARANASPGVIDGLMGQSTTDAIEAFERMNGFDVDGELDEKVKKALPSGDVVKTYTITEEDAAYDLTGDIPDRYDEMAKLDKMGFQSHAEMIAERFEMDIDLLKELNPEADFAKAGTKVIVTDVRAQDARKVTKIEIRKDGTQLYGYGADDKLIWSAPASIGSEQTPSPSGEMKVSVIAPEPNYTFDPDTLRDAKTTEKVVIQPGPNGPVGAMWIGLTKDGYGIHGTPDPAEISRTQSHGCVRLTNWDATALAQLVTPDETEVVFMN